MHITNNDGIAET